MHKIISILIILSFITTGNVYAAGGALRPPMASGHTVRGAAGISNLIAEHTLHERLGTITRYFEHELKEIGVQVGFTVDPEELNFRRKQIGYVSVAQSGPADRTGEKEIQIIALNYIVGPGVDWRGLVDDILSGAAKEASKGEGWKQFYRQRLLTAIDIRAEQLELMLEPALAVMQGL